MSFVPDFGMRLVRDGASRELDVHLVPFQLDHISVVDEESFTTMSNVEVYGETHAISLDFDLEILGAIMSLCPDEIAHFIATDLMNNSFAGHTSELPEPINFAVTARLGELQTADQEQYIPLLAQSVSKLSDGEEDS